VSIDATQAEPSQDPGQPAADPQFYRHVLHGLINTGAGFTRLLFEQATAQAQANQAQPAQPQPAQQRPEPHPAPAASLQDLAAAFDSISRTVRRCIMLAQSLDTPKQPRIPAANRTAARKHILRAVEDTLQRQDYDDSYRDCDPTEVLHAELLDRMDAPDLDADIANRPIDDIIKNILRDLGLAALPGTRPWKRRTPADIAELNARAAAPARQSGAGPQEPSSDAGQRPPAGPPPAGPGSTGNPPLNPLPPEPTATPRADPAHAGPGLPDDPAEAVAFVLRHAADARWRLPPEA
jgi:hypothetical protein